MTTHDEKKPDTSAMRSPGDPMKSSGDAAAPTKAAEQANAQRDRVQSLKRELLKVEQEINRYQSIPRNSLGETWPLGNAPTPDPIEPTVNEPGNVVLKTPEGAPPAGEAPRK